MEELPADDTRDQPRATGRAPGPLARLDRIPVWPDERKLLWVIGAGYFFAFFDIVTISYALPVIAKQFHVSKGTVALSVTSSLIGYIIGAFADSTIADKWGRRLSLSISVAVFSLGTVLAALSSGVVELIIFRFISGLGIGAEIAAVTTYIGEISPAPLRGRYTSWATTSRMPALPWCHSSPAVWFRHSRPGGGSCS
jgi:MFS transporter, putative metabolite:H+ symporter